MFLIFSAKLYGIKNAYKLYCGETVFFCNEPYKHAFLVVLFPGHYLFKELHVI